MKSLLKHTLLGLALSTSSLAMAAEAPLNLGEHYTLRAYTGQTIGNGLAELLNVKTLGIAENTSSICATLSGAITAEFISENTRNDAVSIAAMSSPEDAAQLNASLLDKDAIALVFGGQVKPADNYALVKATLKTLAQQNYSGAIFFHLAVWAPKMMEKAAAEDTTIANYLSQKTNLYTATINPKKGMVLIHQAALQDGKQASVKILEEVKMNERWLTLFKRSMIKRS